MTRRRASDQHGSSDATVGWRSLEMAAFTAISYTARFGPAVWLKLSNDSHRQKSRDHRRVHETVTQLNHSNVIYLILLVARHR